MKYYLCIEEPHTTKNEENINLFIQEMFGHNYSNKIRYSNSIRYANYYNYEDYIEDYKKYGFSKGRIYHTLEWSDEYIIDDNSNTHKLVEVMQYFKEYHLEIDAETQKIIKTKKRKGDTIIIKPFSYDFKAEKTIYIITIYSDFRTISPVSISIKNTMDYSILDGIIYCYKCLREDVKETRLIKRCLEGKAYEGVRKHT